MSSVARPRVPRFAAVACAALAAVAVAAQWVVTRGHHDVGLDLRPLYGAGQAVLAGRPIYDVRGFVYPPSAALAAVPLTRIPLPRLADAYLATELLLLVTMAVVVVRWLVPPRWRAACAGLAAAALVWSHPAVHGLWLGNLSVLVAAAGLAVVLLFGRGRWGAGCLLLAATLLLKPLLLPLLLIPLLQRRFRPLAGALAIAAAVLALSGLLTTGLGRLPHVAVLLLHGSVLVGALSADNLSLAGFAAAHRLPGPVTLVARAVVTAAAVWVCWLVARRRPALDPPRAACLASALLLALFLAGSLSEVHYVFAVLPGGFAALAVVAQTRAVRLAPGHRGGVQVTEVVAVAAVVVGAVATLAPVRNAPPLTHQGLLVLSEVAFLVATVLAVSLLPATTDVGPGSLPPGSRVLR